MESWLAAEIRATYFADLVQRFHFRQRLFVVGSLLLSSGATVALLTAIVPANLSWIKPALTLLAAGLSLWPLVAKNERNSIECADLHFRWNALALQYETLWSSMFTVEAEEQLARLRLEELAISKGSTSQPAYKSLLKKAQANVIMHHQHHLAA